MFNNWCRVVELPEKEADVLVRKAYNNDEDKFLVLFITYNGDLEIKSEIGFSSEDARDLAYDKANANNINELLGAMIDMAISDYTFP